MMIESRNIAQEFAEARRLCLARSPEARPYHFHLGGNNQVIMDLLAQHGIRPPQSRWKSQQKKFPSGHQDILVTDLEVGYAIYAPRDNFQPGEEQIKIMADSMIINRDDRRGVRIYGDLYRHITEGNISYAGFERGAYGAVGKLPISVTSSEERVWPGVCVKYFNYAFPFSLERWQKSITDHDKVGGEWNLSGVTGVGNYMALRYLHEGGVPAPKVCLATNELLIMEFIDGYTIGEIKDRYEEFKAAGILGDDDSVIDGIWDFLEEYEPKLKEAIESIIEPIRHEYWAPDFQHYDVNMGNIMLKRDGLRDPANNYCVIDPLR